MRRFNLMLMFMLAVVTTLHARPAATSLLRGTATIVDGSAVPRGSRLRVDLHDLTPGISRLAHVASQTFDVEGKAPIRFELKYIDSVVAPDRLYGVAATLMNSRGRAVWETRVPIRVLTLGNQKRVELVLRPANQREAPPEPTAFAFACEGLQFDVRLDDAAATVVVEGSRVVLPRTETSSSKRFSDGSTTLAVSGRAVYFQRPGRAFRDCKMIAQGRP